MNYTLDRSRLAEVHKPLHRSSGFDAPEEEVRNKTPARCRLRASESSSRLRPLRCPASPTSAGERANHILLTGQSSLIFLPYGPSAVVKRQHGGACPDVAMYGGFSHCLADDGTFPEDAVLPPVPDR
jgi:hypothetical protein